MRLAALAGITGTALQTESRRTEPVNGEDPWVAMAWLLASTSLGRSRQCKPLQDKRLHTQGRVDSLQAVCKEAADIKVKGIHTHFTKKILEMLILLAFNRLTLFCSRSDLRYIVGMCPFPKNTTKSFWHPNPLVRSDTRFEELWVTWPNIAFPHKSAPRLARNWESNNPTSPLLTMLLCQHLAFFVVWARVKICNGSGPEESSPARPVLLGRF